MGGSNLYDVVPKYNEYFLFMDMVKGHRVEHMFFGNTSCVQVFKREYLKEWVYKSADKGMFKITSGDESISNSLSKNVLSDICKSNNLPFTGNKIDLVRRIKSVNINAFSGYDISDWILVTKEGAKHLDEYKKGFKADYDIMQQYIYDLLLNNKKIEAIKIVEYYKSSYPFDRSSSFFISHSTNELVNIINKIKSTNIFDKIGFAHPLINAFKTVMCMSYLFGDVMLDEKFEELMPGAVEFLKKSKFIKNKDVPFIDLKNLILGYEVYKF